MLKQELTRDRTVVDIRNTNASVQVQLNPGYELAKARVQENTKKQQYDFHAKAQG